MAAIKSKLGQARKAVLWTMFSGFEKVMGLLPGGRDEFHNLDDHPWTPAVEAHWREIRAELDRVLDVVEIVPNFQDLAPEQQGLTSDDRWKTLWFHANGTPIEANLARFPATAAALEAIPNMRSAMFSILRGPKSLAPHRGPYKGFLRYHLALKVPDVEACWIRVGSETRHWVEGESMIFDDTFQHEAHNETTEDRVVLFVDFLRPMPRPLQWINRRVVAAMAGHSSLRAFLERANRWEDMNGPELDQADAG